MAIALELAWTDAAREASAAARKASGGAHESTMATKVHGGSGVRTAVDYSKRANAASNSIDEKIDHKNMADAAKAHEGAAANHEASGDKHTAMAGRGVSKEHEASHLNAAKDHYAAAALHGKAARAMNAEAAKPGVVQNFGRGENKVAMKVDKVGKEHMRIATMNTDGLRNRIDKIRDPAKMQRFAKALREEGKGTLAGEAKRKLRGMGLAHPNQYTSGDSEGEKQFPKLEGADAQSKAAHSATAKAEGYDNENGIDNDRATPRAYRDSADLHQKASDAHMDAANMHSKVAIKVKHANLAAKHDEKASLYSHRAEKIEGERKLNLSSANQYTAGNAQAASDAAEKASKDAEDGYGTHAHAAMLHRKAAELHEGTASMTDSDNKRSQHYDKAGEHTDKAAEHSQRAKELGGGKPRFLSDAPDPRLSGEKPVNPLLADAAARSANNTVGSTLGTSMGQGARGNGNANFQGDYRTAPRMRQY